MTLTLSTDGSVHGKSDKPSLMRKKLMQSRISLTWIALIVVGFVSVQLMGHVGQDFGQVPTKQDGGAGFVHEPPQL